MKHKSETIPHLVILGAGFAGLGAAVKLKHAPMKITLIDQNSYNTFQPLLYQVATSILEPTVVGESVHSFVHDQENLTFKQAVVTDITLNERRIGLSNDEVLDFDYLMLALGAKVNYFKIPGAGEYAFPLYTLQDAVKLQEHILQIFDRIEQDPALVEDGLLNFVVLGGGPTGVETAGALAQFVFHEVNLEYPHIPTDKAQIILVDASPSLVKMFKEDLRHYTKNALQELGVTVLLNERLVQIEPDRVTLSSGDKIKTSTLIWAAGMHANSLVHALDLELGPGGRIPVSKTLNLEEYPHIFVVGDMAIIKDKHGRDALPQLGSVAMQSGEHAAENIERMVKQRRLKPFKYLDKGTMATIGRGRAVLQMPRGRSMTGRKAWLAWGTVHLALIPDRHDRRSALKRWANILYNQNRLSGQELGEEPEAENSG